MKDVTLSRGLADHVAVSSAPDFGRLAHIYRWMEWFSFGPFISRCRCAFLPDLRDRKTALVLGDGDGRFTARLMNENSHIHVDAVDASDAMLRELTRHAASNVGRLQTFVADARSFAPRFRSYDLIATHFFLDCLTTEEVEEVAARLRRQVETSAEWVVSEFAVPGGRFGRFIARPVVAALYLAFGWLTGLEIRRLPDHRSAMERAGWRLVSERKFLAGLLVSEFWRP